MTSHSEADLKLEELADQIKSVGNRLEPIEELVETRKWDQRAFLPNRPRIGTTIRIGHASETKIAMYVHCQTTLIDTYRSLFPHLTFQGSRAIVFDVHSPLPKKELDMCIEAALLYHYHKKKTRNS